MSKPVPVRTVFLSSVEASRAKSYLLFSLSGKPFPEDYEPTIFENFRKIFNYKGTNLEFSLWDTSGQEEYSRMRPMSYAKSDVTVLVFSLDYKKTLTDLEVYIGEIKEYCPQAAKILVGIKLENKDDDDGEPDPPSESEIEEWAKNNGINATIKRTLKNGDDFDQVFEIFAENYVATHKKDDKSCNIY